MVLGSWVTMMAQSPANSRVMHLEGEVITYDRDISDVEEIVLDKGTRIGTNAHVTLHGCYSIKLGEGFSLGPGAELVATVEEDCKKSAEPMGISPEGSSLSIGPNPVIRQAIIVLDLDQNDPARVDLYDQNGRQVMELLPQGDYPAGRSEHSIDLSTLPAGAYFYRADLGGKNLTGKLIRID